MTDRQTIPAALRGAATDLRRLARTMPEVGRRKQEEGLLRAALLLDEQAENAEAQPTTAAAQAAPPAADLAAIAELDRLRLRFADAAADLARLTLERGERMRTEQQLRHRIDELEALDLGAVDGRVSASCADPEHPTWLRTKDDTRGCPWCRVAELEAQAAELRRYRQANESGPLFRIIDDRIVGELFAGELEGLRSLRSLLTTTAKHGTLDEVRQQLAEHVEEERAALAEQQRRDGCTRRPGCECPWCGGDLGDETDAAVPLPGSPAHTAGAAPDPAAARRLRAVEQLCSGRPGYHTVTVKALLSAMSDANDDAVQPDPAAPAGPGLTWARQLNPTQLGEFLDELGGAANILDPAVSLTEVERVLNTWTLAALAAGADQLLAEHADTDEESGYRDDVRDALTRAGWTENRDGCLVAPNGALWTETNDCLDSQLGGPGKGWSIAFDSGVPAVAIVSACLAAAKQPTA